MAVNDVLEIIRKKRDGGRLTADDMDVLVRGAADGSIPDYQLAAWLMAAYLRSLDYEETTHLARAMAASGAMLDLSPIPGPKVDKHSTGGVGDKVSLVVLPLVAACGVTVAKMSGRGLGHTGGTVDKLESIPGMRVEMDVEEFLSCVRVAGIAIAGQSSSLVPADKKLYSLREVTATVDSIPLIASSIMSKKIAAGTDGVVLDVKVGRGAFMRELDSARQLARLMVRIGEACGLATVAVLSNMDQPLGYRVGNALEVREAIEVLAGQGPHDVVELTYRLGSEMLILAGLAQDRKEARRSLHRALTKGYGLEKLAQMIRTQGGNPHVVEEPALLPRAPVIRPLVAAADGYVREVDARLVGWACVLLGAGRRKRGAAVDPAVGIELRKKVGDAVKAGEPLACIHARTAETASRAARLLEKAYRVLDRPGPCPPVVLEMVSPNA